MRKKSLLFGLFFTSFILTTLFQNNLGIVNAQESTNFSSDNKAYNTVNVYLFRGDGCPHCEAEVEFLNEVVRTIPQVRVIDYEVWYNQKNGKLLQRIGESLDINIQGVPFTAIGPYYIAGYESMETTGFELLGYITQCLTTECEDPIAKIIEEELSPKPSPTPTPTPTVTSTPNPTPTSGMSPTPTPDTIPTPTPSISGNTTEKPIKDKIINLPIIGKTNLSLLSLPVIAILIGTLDGFNPCAMWVLLFLISLLLNLKDKKRMWLLGAVFIISSSFVYFIFMSAWLNILLFIGLVLWIRIAIAGFAFVAGLSNLRKYWQHHTGCIVENSEGRKKIFEKLKNLTTQKSLPFAVLGIMGLAFAVNLLELMCSAGFPALFTQILAMHNLTTPMYYLYILLYIFFFMLDDMIVFIIAMKTLESTGISTKYVKYSHLIGGLLMLTIAILLIIKPSYLMFNF